LVCVVCMVVVFLSLCLRVCLPLSAPCGPLAVWVCSRWQRRAEE
jgi:hypothetical protein